MLSGTGVPRACCMQAAASDSRAGSLLLLLPPPTWRGELSCSPNVHLYPEGDTIDVRGPWGEFNYLGAGRFT